MKIGFILECQRDGPDEKVVEYLLKRHAPQVEYTIRTMGNARELRERGAGVVAELLETEACDRVVLVWDSYPGWGGSVCPVEHRAEIVDALQQEGIHYLAHTRFVCIQAMLESWFLADPAAIAGYLSTKTRNRTVTSQQVGRFPHPEDETEAKSRLEKAFERQKLPRYRDFQDAARLAEAMGDWGEVQRKCPSFRRFLQAIT